jgi:hypothetical protein
VKVLKYRATSCNLEANHSFIAFNDARMGHLFDFALTGLMSFANAALLSSSSLVQSRIALSRSSNVLVADGASAARPLGMETGKALF